MQLDDLLPPVVVIELAHRERRLAIRARQTRDVDRWELRHELAASLVDELRQLRLVIREVHERRRRAEFLSLEQHRRLWTKNHERCQGA